MNVINTTVAAGQTKVINILDRDWKYPVNVMAKAGAGGTVKVEFSMTATAYETPGTATWIDANVPSSTTGNEVTRYAPAVAVRLSATTQTGTFELVL